MTEVLPESPPHEPARAASSLPRRVEVVAGSRLHWGLWNWGGPPGHVAEGRQFGGVGVMIAEPELRLTVARADPSDPIQVPTHREVPANGEALDAATRRAQAAADRAVAELGAALAVKATVSAAPPEHAGLGSGTQTTLAAYAAVRCLVRGGPPTSTELAAAAVRMGRARRSSIGVLGFSAGGCWVDLGKQTPDDPSAGLRFDFPESWRIVLLRPTVRAGLSGARERAAFERLPPAPPELTDRLCGVVLRELIPALTAGDCPAFAAALGEYGRRVGGAFAPCQGGEFADPAGAEWAARLTAWGVRGTVQSSWGPTLSIVTACPAEAEELAARIAGARDAPPWVRVVRPLRRGAAIAADRPGEGE